LIVFAFSFIIVFPLYFIIFSLYKNPKATIIAHQKISRPWARSLFPAFGIRIIVKNKHLLDPNKTYVFISNHRSQLDIPALAVATNHTFRFLAKSELMKIPVLGYVIRKLYISVDRSDKAARARSMESMLNSLRENISVSIYPEGTRNKTAAPLLNFHDGAFRLAITAQVPLAIMVVINSDKLLSPLKPVELSPGTLICKWTTPIDTTGMTINDLESLKTLAAQRMIEMMNESKS
jgi:1-acyl-sn-glycerol-3-phosphate acyltransferase